MEAAERQAREKERNEAELRSRRNADLLDARK